MPESYPLTFSNKVKEGVIAAQEGYCKGCLSKIHSIHHKLSNNKANRRLFPKYLHSPFNAIGLCEYHHKERSHEYKVTIKEAEMYETYLRNIKTQAIIDSNKHTMEF